MSKPEVVNLKSPRRDRMVGGVDIRDIASCMCLRMRKSSRQLTQIYDAALAPSGLTIGQFGVLAQVYGVQLQSNGPSVKELATRLGMDPTTLNRALKPLLSAGYLQVAADPENWRAKVVSITPAGETKLSAAAPLWQRADRATDSALGEETALVLRGLMDLATSKLSAE